MILHTSKQSLSQQGFEFGAEYCSEIPVLTLDIKIKIENTHKLEKYAMSSFLYGSHMRVLC